MYACVYVHRITTGDDVDMSPQNVHFHTKCIHLNVCMHVTSTVRLGFSRFEIHKNIKKICIM